MSNKLISLNSKSTLSKLENKVATTTRLINIINFDRLVNLLTKKKEFFFEFVITNCELSSSNKKQIEDFFLVHPEFLTFQDYKLNYNYFNKCLTLFPKWCELLQDKNNTIFSNINDNNLYLLTHNPYFPWTIELIEKYSSNWRFIYNISDNINLPWSIDLIKRYEESWDYNALLKNESVPWDICLIDKYSEKWEWAFFSMSESLPWSEELIDKYSEKWCWLWLSMNESLPCWSEEFIDKYSEKWYWDPLTMNSKINWSESLIDKYLINFDGKEWVNLILNPSIIWSEELIDKYSIYFDIENQLYGAKVYTGKNLSSNETLYFNAWNALARCENMHWSIGLLKKYKDKFDINFAWTGNSEFNISYPTGLSSNPNLPWSEELIDSYIDKWEWSLLQRNSGIYWNTNLLKKYEDKIKLEEFLWNKNFKWSINLFNKLLERYDFYINDSENPYHGDLDVFSYYLSVDDLLMDLSPQTWTYDFICHFHSKYLKSSAFKVAASQYCRNLNFGLIKQLDGILDFKILSKNNSIFWTLDLLTEYADKWDYNNLLQNQTFIESMAPYFNDKLIEKVLSQIISNENTSLF